MEHELKTIQPFFDDVWCGKKLFEYRNNDRNYRVGDTLKLREYSTSSGYTNKYIMCDVIYIFDHGFNLPEGYCILGIDVIARCYE